MNVYKVSASNLQMFLSCKYGYKLKYHDKIKGLKLSNKWTTPGSAVHSALERYFKEFAEFKEIKWKELSEFLAEECGNYGVDSSMYREVMSYMKSWAKRFRVPHKILALEYQIDMTLPNGIPILGYIDMIAEKEDGTIVLYDWKTGNNPFTEDDLEDNVQAPLYIIAIKQEYPDRNIEFIFDFVKYNQIQYTYTDSKMRSFIKWLTGTVDAIKKTDPEDVNPQLGYGCRFCEYKDMCPDMKRVKEQGFQFDASTAKSLSNLISDQQSINGALKALKEENDRLRALILEKMDDEIYENDDYRAKIVRRQNVNYDTNLVLDAFKKTDHLTDIISIKKTGVKKHLDKLPEHVAADIEDNVQTYYSNPYVKVTKKRKNK